MRKYTGLEVAVIGLAGRFPQADTIEQYWENLKNGKDCISELSDAELLAEGVSEQLLKNKDYVKANSYLENKKYFDAEFFGYRPDEAELMDPQLRIFHECCWEALEDSGYSTTALKEKVGVFATGTPNVNWVLYSMHKNREQLVDDFSASHLREVSFLSSRIAYKFNLKGPAVYLQTACSSSLVAIHEACNSLLLGECGMALAGGIAVHNYSKKGYLYEKGMITSKDGKCRPFDVDSDGTVGGEGAGVIVLKKLKDAIRDRDNIYGIIKGTAINNDGNSKVGYTAPSVKGQVDAIKKAHKMAGVDSSSITYIETHGTATALGDAIEIEALNEAFGNEKVIKCAIGSVKSNIGHLDTAAGVAGFIKTILTLKHKQLPPSLHFTAPNANISFTNGPFYVNNKLTSWQQQSGEPLRAGVSSFGIGGTNAHIVLEEAPELELQPQTRDHQLIFLSAKSQASLEENTVRLTDYFKKENPASLADIAYTLQKGRDKFKYRRMLIAANGAEAIQILTDHKFIDHNASETQEDLQNIVFMFSGQGAQYINMYQDLYEKEGFFKDQVDACFEIAKTYTDADLQAVLTNKDGQNKTINNTQYAQPLLFIMEYAMAKLLMRWCVKPEYMIGHSVGEYVAACISGVFSLNDAIRLVVRRGQLMSEVEQGGMLSINCTEKELNLLKENFEGIDVAALNSENSCVVAGTTAAIETFEAHVKLSGYEAKLLHTSHAFHSHMMDEILSKFEQEVSLVTINQPQIPYVSNLSGELVTCEELKTPAYWSKHLRSTVNFLKGSQWLLNQGDAVFIEIGPGRALSNYLSENKLKTAGHHILNTTRQFNQQINDQKYLIEKLGRLWLLGVKVDWDSYYTDEQRQKVSLPAYAFHKTPFTTDVDAFTLVQSQLKALPPVSGTHVENYIHAHSWQLSSLPNEAAELKEKQMNFLVFSGTEVLSSAILKDLQSNGQNVIEIRNGSVFRKLDNQHYELNLTQTEALAELWNDLAAQELTIHHIIYCRALSSQPLTVKYEAIETQFSTGYIGLSCLAKSLSIAGRSEPVQLTVINNRLANVTEGDQVDPLKASIQGPSRVIPLEMMNIKCKVLDIPYPFKNENQLHDYSIQLINEILYESNDPFVAYRYKQRWVRAFNSFDSNAKVGSNVAIVNGGTYLITGGFGGMGFAIAANLVHQHQANVILVHRSDFPGKGQWSNWIAANGKQDRISIKIMELQHMEATGCTVTLRQLDVSNEEQVKIMASEIQQYGLNGLIWAAGEIDYGGILLNRDKNELIQSVSSKVHGLLLFEKYLNFKNLDFISLFSSVGNVLYQSKFGQTAYNAANEFLENYPYYIKKKTGTHAFAINWCDWLNVGMTIKARLKTANTNDVDLINSQITDGIYPEDGVKIFHHCLQSKVQVSTIYKENIGAAIRAYQAEFSEVKANLVNVAPVAEKAGPLSGTLEEKLTAIFAEFFGKTDIGLDDDFFELGGDSLRGMTFIARVNQKLGVNYSVKDVFKYPTLRLLRSKLESDEPDSSFAEIPEAELKENYSLSSAQKRMYFLQMFDKESIVYNETILFWLKGDLNTVKFENAFRKLIARHESLRTSFVFENETPKQVILENFNFNVAQLTAPSTAIEEAITAFIQPFDLAAGPLVRVGMLENNPAETLVIIDMHHIITDGVSRGILIKDFMSLYNEEQLPALKLQYKDYAEWQQSAAQKQEILNQKDFWLKQFEEEPAILQLPIDNERPLVKSNAGDSINFALGQAETIQLKAIAEAENTSVFMLLLAVYNVLLAKITSQDDIVIGTPTAGRGHADLENMAGMFVNMIPLRNHADATLGFKEFLSQVKTNCLDFFANQSYQYEELIEALKIERDMGRNPLFDVVFSHENFDFSAFKIPGLEMENYDNGSKISKFDLRLTTVESEDGIFGTFEYATSLFRKETIENFIIYFKQIIAVVLANAEVKIGNIEFIGEKERHQLLKEFNDTEESYEGQKLLTELFEEQVLKSLDKPAILADGITFSYEWLNTAANKVAHILRTSGVKREDAVVVIMERRVELIIALLGILKAGGKYVPVEPYLPASRIGIILESVEAGYILTDYDYYETARSLKEEAPKVNSVIAIDVNSKRDLAVHQFENGSANPVNVSAYAATNLPVCNSSEDLAYVIFTSGSTGNPKGVAVQHKPVINLIEWVNKTYHVGEQDKLLFVSSISFDLSVYDIFGMLAAGGMLRIANRKELEDPDTLAEIMVEEGITFWDSAPAMLQQVIPFLENRQTQARAKGQLRIAFLSGDWIPLTMPVQMKSLFAKLRFIALGGATEATVWSNFFEVDQVDPAWKSIPYGKPIQNAKYLVLNKSLNVCPAGLAGDLYIGGQCLAQGYINDKELSDKKFIASPFDAGEMLYETGDMARWLPDGNIEFLGRNDSQIKIRGFRIELGEIERKLVEFEGVKQVLTQVITKSKYDKSICVYYVAAVPLAEDEMRSFLSKDLPPYMIPKYFVHIERVPVTKNGKIDRKQLPLPVQAAKGEDIQKPKTYIQKKLTTIWADLLQIDSQTIDVRDDFFTLGGHSILAVHLINTIRQEFHINLKLRKIFENSTVEKLAELMEHSEIEISLDVQDSDQPGMITGNRPLNGQLKVISKAAKRELYPVSHAQERLYYEQMLNKDNVSYNVYGVYEIKGAVEEEKLAAAFQKLVDRHDTLRTSFLLKEDTLLQRINEGVEFNLIHLDDNKYQGIKEAFADFIQPFDLSADSLLRAALLNYKGTRLLFVDIHHIVCDGISLNILMNDFKQLYTGHDLPALDLSYVDYAVWQKETAAIEEQQKQYWMNQLAGELPQLSLPVSQDREYVSIQSAATGSMEISGTQYNQIKEFIATSKVTDYMFFLSVYYLLLAKISGDTDIIIGTDMIGRTQTELQDVVGTFINLLPLRLQLQPEESYTVFLEKVKNCVLGAFENQDYQYDQIISLLNQEERLEGKLIHVHFAFANYFDQQTTQNELDIVPFETALKESTQFEFKIEAREEGGKYYLSFIYSDELYTAEVISLLMEYYSNILNTVLHETQISIEEIELENVLGQAC